MQKDQNELRNALESALRKVDGIRQAKVIDISPNGNAPQLAVALTLAATDLTAKNDALPIIKSARKAAIRMVKNTFGVEGKSLVPKSWTVLEELPLTVDGRPDERALRQRISGETEATDSNLSKQEKRRRLIDEESTRTLHARPDEDLPTTELELVIRMLWAQVLRIHPQAVGRHDSFLAKGGDSITAIELVALALEYGVVLTAANIMQLPRLHEMASLAVIEDYNYSHDTEPFSLIPPERLEDIKEQARSSCQLSVAQDLEDLYPCTSLQEGLMALSLKQPGSYIHQNVFRIPPTTDVERFKSSWQRTVRLCGNMRTRVVLIGNEALQVLIRDDDLWEETSQVTSVSAYLAEARRDIDMSYGDRLCRYAIVQERDATYFVWMMHHSVLDGLTAKIVLDVCHRSYLGLEVRPLRSYSNFIDYIRKVDYESAEIYWRDQLRRAGHLSFPPAHLTKKSSTNSGRVMKKSIPSHQAPGNSFTKATILRAAWAIVLAKYCDTDDVYFGATVSGRHAPIAGLSEMPGPMIATVPIRVHLSINGASPSVAEFLEAVQSQASEMVPFEQFGLQNIARLGIDERNACSFTSLLVVQPAQALVSTAMGSSRDAIMVHGEAEKALSEEAMRNHFNYPLVLETFMEDGRVLLHWTYCSNVLTESQIDALSHHYERVVNQLLDGTYVNVPIKELPLVGEWDEKRADELKGEEPDIVDACIHEMVTMRAREHPDALAVDAWDGRWTYRQLDEASTKLGEYLVRSYGIRVDDLIHVLFEKSAWYVISILAINKAGAAWVPLEPSHPLHRHQQVVQQTKAQLVLTSSLHRSLCENLVDNVLEVSSELFVSTLDEDISLSLPVRRPLATPRNAAYALFTSGSTGIPKGFVMEHGSVCTSQVNIGKRVGISPHLRSLQFASYAFDLSVLETIGLLIHGGCVCVPSEETRMNNLQEFVRNMDVSMLIMTPSFARTLQPADFPSVRLMIVGGEALSRDVLESWFGHARLFNGWGPAETCVFSTFHEITSPNENTMTIGRPVGCFCYVVDAEDPRKLAPVGCVGEIVVQGPTLLREYLGDLEKTKAATVYELPLWAPRRDAPFNRFYKSGDLCYHDPEGRLVFAHRKDTQVKIRGLRVELGEVEHHIRKTYKNAQQVVVEALRVDGAGSSLVAYICHSNDTHLYNAADPVADVASTLFLPATETTKGEIAEMVEQLAVVLPRYMIPLLFIPCRFMPCISSTKIDRRSLLRETASLNEEQLSAYALVDNIKKAPETSMERRMQILWASNLKMSAGSIGRDDDYFRIGGDSMSAIHLATAAREAGINIEVKDVFDDPRLCKVAARAEEKEAVAGSHATKQFELLTPDVVSNILSDEFREENGLSEGNIIQNAFPCTSLQEGLMALAHKQPGSYVAKHIYRIPSHINVDRLKRAWEKTVESCEALRTRIVTVGRSTMQIILKEPHFKWEDAQGQSLKSYLELANNIHMGYKSRLCRATLVEENRDDLYLVIIIHHAVFDGWTLDLIINTLTAAYHRTEPPSLQSYATFIRFLQEVDQGKAAEYWRDQLLGASRASFPPPKDTNSQTRTSRLHDHTIEFVRATDSSITTATILRAAWLIVLARYSDTDDICAGATVSGRNAPLDGLGFVPGLVVATVPVRAKLDRQQRVSQFLADVQAQSSNMGAHEQFGLKEISRLGPEFKEACDFTSLITVQPMQYTNASNKTNGGGAILTSTREEQMMALDAMQSYFSYPLVMQCYLGQDRVDLMLVYDPEVLSLQQMRAISIQFENVFQQLLSKPDALLGDVSIAGPWDLQQALEWNSQTIAHERRCITDMIAEQTARSPEHEALWSTEGSLSYSALDHATSRLASYLISLGVTKESVVPFCFEKSMWAVVAMLGILKAGAAFMPLDPSHPTSRKETLVKEARADKVLLASPSSVLSCSNIIRAWVVSAESIAQLPDSDFALPEPSHSDAAYVLFTSGSTGTPKGIVVEHAALSTSTVGQAPTFGIDSSTRALQFSSYVFDGSLSEILTTLAFGGTVCIPSDIERLQSVADFINRAQVNLAMLTPSFIRTMTPHTVPTLKTLISCGEAAAKDILDTWQGNVTLINGYGPAETCIYCATHTFRSAQDVPGIIGRGFNSACWIVDSENHDQLAPIGCSGELLIQGHAIARGYINGATKNEAAFLRSIPWAPDSSLRCYKTGDLVRYTSDGLIEYLGRKDTQVKLRGQRMELGEVEYHIKRVINDAEHVAVDMVHRGAGQVLVAFVSFAGTKLRVDPGDENLIVDKDVVSSLQLAFVSLKAALPKFMIPTLILPLRKMPFTTSMKTDRKMLKRIVTDLSPELVSTFSLLKRERVSPTTDMEFRLRKIWASILKMNEADIGRHDGFLHIGGDSISAIHLISLAEQQGIKLSIANIFSDSRLETMAASASTSVGAEATDKSEVPPFSLLPDQDIKSAVVDMHSKCRLPSAGLVQDAYPCAALQEGLMALGAKKPGSYVARHIYKLSEHVDTCRFKTSWEQTLQVCDILRTRIIVMNGRSVQVVLSTDTMDWEDTTDTSVGQFILQTEGYEMGYGDRLSRFGVVHENGHAYFVWTVHHALFDGWTIQLILDVLQKSYLGRELPKIEPYSRFIKYTTELDHEKAAKFWTCQLEHAQKAAFPLEVNNSREKTAANSSMNLAKRRKTTFALPRFSGAGSSVTKASVLRAAWAIVLARYCDTNDVCFGTTVSGRQAPLHGLMDMAGPVLATLPIHVRLDRSLTVSQFLKEIQTQYMDMIDWEQFGLQNIAKLSADAKEACDFSSLLVIQPMKHLNMADGTTLLVPDNCHTEEHLFQNYFNYPLVLQIELYEKEVDMSIIYDTSVLQEQQVDALSAQYEHVVGQLMTSATEDAQLLAEISVSGPYDLSFALNANENVPEHIKNTMFHLIEAQAERTPDSLAVDAWDRRFTYREVNCAANRLAHHLVANLGVRVGDAVHVCFEKSAWYVVAVLAVNKAGAAWVPMDPSHPPHRLRQLVEQTGSILGVASLKGAALCAELLPSVVVLSEDFDKELSVADPNEKTVYAPPNVAVSDRDVMYILFTSGSTGKPKGVIIEHGSCCTSTTATLKRLGITADARFLQFSAHVFDGSVTEIFGMLIQGACVCIPSDHARMNDLAGFIQDYNVGWAWLTPSFARTIRPAEVPSLKVLGLMGEAISRDVFEMWFGKVRLFNAWGPSEVCVVGATHEWTSLAESSRTIGAPVGSLGWIVDADDPQRLAPIGCVGEIVMQGPSLLRAYLGDADKTAAAIVSSVPSWAPFRHSAAWSRFYKTGDLCSYNPDGTIQYHGRKDTQVKIRGLRVELGEVEHHIRTKLASVVQVVVDVFQTEASSNLICYLCFSEDKHVSTSDLTCQDIFEPMSKELQANISAMVTELQVTVPTYMLPTFFVPCQFMPLMSSGKIDRKTLNSTCSKLSLDTLAEYSLRDTNKAPLQTDTEERMQQLWAKILKIPSDTIGRDDGFFQVGGDSIAAIELVTSARDAGIHLTVKDIFDDPRLWSIAGKVDSASTSAPSFPDPIKSFSLLDKSMRDQVTSPGVMDDCGILPTQIVEDAFPCTKLQEGLMTLAVTQPGSYIAKYVFELGRTTSFERVKEAWERTVETCACLRTRITRVDGTCVQLIVKNDIHWDSPSRGLASYLEDCRDLRMQYGSRLSRYALLTDKDGKQYFVWILHHAIHDGWTMNLIQQVFSNEYHSLPSPAMQPYSRLIKYVMEMDEGAARSYWDQQLQGARRAAFPAPATTIQAAAGLTRTMQSTITFPKGQETSITKATALRAAWSIVLARYSDTDDICFATTVSGRQAPIPGITNMPGAALTTVPVRIKLRDHGTVAGFLQAVQNQATDMVAFEQYGLQRIQTVNTNAKEACMFSSLLAVQPVQQRVFLEPGQKGDMSIMVPAETKYNSTEQLMQNYLNYPLAVQAWLSEQDVQLILVYDSAALEEARMIALTKHMEHVLTQLLTLPDLLLEDVSVAGPWDLQQAMRWDESNLSAANVCVHDLVSAQAARSPDKEAIYSTGRSMTYAELESLSDRLANHFFDLGIRSETRVPVCFEKSIWAIVAMLGIVKAGGVFVPLDPLHPESRRRALIAEVGARHLVVSSATVESSAGMAELVIEITEDMVSRLPAETENSHQSHRHSHRPKPHHGAYILFTSGSTGTPKGVLITHSSITSALLAEREAVSLTESSRVFQFSSYVFDGMIFEIFGALIHGCTVCVPNETERMQTTAKFMEQAKVTVAFFTPSFVKTLDPCEVPSFRTLLVGGEVVPKEVVERWFGYVDMRNVYGPAECCIMSTVHIYKSKNDPSSTIGRSFAHRCWVVDADNHNRLAPIGCVGELVLQGHAIAQGYANNEPKTREVFLESTAWMPTFLVNDTHRLYKTGDLVRYTTTGELEMLGRKDTQVKIRGQRIELGEIEYQIVKALPEHSHVIVDVINRYGPQESLAAFICRVEGSREQTSGPAVEIRLETDKKLFSALAKTLASILPDTMVPKYFFPVERMPRSSSDKIDRMALREAVSRFSADRLAKYLAASTSTFQECSTDLEKWLRRQWSIVLDIEEQSIGANDNFYQLGGDSIRIVSVSKRILDEHRVSLGITLINSHNTTIGAMAKYIEDEKGEVEQESDTAMNLEAEIAVRVEEPWAKIPRGLLQRPMTSLPWNATVFLTGATGFLGTEILRQLLQTPNVETVACLVRAGSVEHGLERIRTTARIAGWWRDDHHFASRLEVWTGDLSKPRMGLGEDKWARLEGRAMDIGVDNIDAIVHNGAVVNWHADWDRLRAANVDSTMDLLRAVALSPVHPKFVFVTGGLRVPPEADRAAVSERFAALNGYVQTKFVSDNIILQVCAKLPPRQNRVSVVMPGRIIGTADEGVSNVDDLIWRLVAGAAALRVYPQEPAHHFMYVEDVGRVAAAVIEQVSSSHPIDPYRHVTGGLPVSVFWEEVNAQLDTPCKPLPWEEWKTLALGQVLEVGERHPLWPVQHFLSEVGAPRMEEGVEGESFGAQRRAVGRSVRYLREVGFVTSTKEGFGEARRAPTIRRMHTV